MSNFNALYLTNGMSTWILVSGALALAGAVIAAYYFLRPKNKARYTGMMQTISAHINFEHLIVPVILKFLYVFSALYAFFSGIVTLINVNIWTGLLTAVLGPLGVRIVYELVLMLFSVLDGIKETNRLLRAGAASRVTTPKPHTRPMHPQHGEEETQDGQPRHYPGGYDPIHKA